MEETPLEASSSFAAPEKRKINKRFIYLVAALIIIALLFFGFKFLGKSKNQNISTPTATTPTDTPTVAPESPSGSPTVSPTNTPTPINPVDKTTGLNRSKLSVTIQNGSGEAGVAGKAADILKNLGYSVGTTGNADNYNFVNVSIQVKAASNDYLALLKKDLAGSYTIGSNSADLSTGFSSDALVIIGKQ